jgi:hypothetical protein
MISDRCVSTPAIREAAKGRELEVLEAVGVFWDDAADHITCPYPDHADSNPSWRWNPKRQRAHCTCTERSHSIFDVVMRCENIDFEAAKLRAAEILGRQDLIKVKDGKRHQAMDAASLFRPPADQRDEALACSYLACRLDVPPDEVPMPSTPAVGWRSLAYYDPPAKRSSQPKLVGHYPCVVFATRSSDGRRHAHRIYVQHDGTGKAELSHRPDGRPRDPKKSARLKEGQSAAGCVVLWGDPGTAADLILSEGIETAAALALARQAQIEAGEAVVAAALSTAGIRSFQPWPATRRITIAADRDEDRPADDRGFKAGEQAAAPSPSRTMTASRSASLCLARRVRTSTGWMSSAETASKPSAPGSKARNGSPPPRRKSTPPSAMRRAPLSSPRSSAPTPCRSWKA